MTNYSLLSRAVLEQNITQMFATRATVYAGAENDRPRRHVHRRSQNRAKSDQSPTHQMPARLPPCQ